MNLKRLAFIFLFLACLAGLFLPRLTLAQADNPQPGATATPQPILLKQDIPGDTLTLLIVAGLLALIVLGGVLWRSRR